MHIFVLIKVLIFLSGSSSGYAETVCYQVVMQVLPNRLLSRSFSATCSLYLWLAKEARIICGVVEECDAGKV